MKKRDIPAALLEWLLICIGVLGSVLCLCSAFSLPVPPALWVLVPLTALCGCLLYWGKPGKYYALGLLALLLFFGFLLRKELLESLRNLWGELCKLYVKGYDRFRDYLPREESSPDAVGPALLLLAVLECYFCTLAVRLWKRTTPAALSLLPGIGLCFILIDTPPALPPLLAAVFALLVLALSQSVRRRGAGEEGKAMLLGAAVAAGLLAVLLLFFPQKGYKPPITWEELNVKMNRWTQKQNNRGNVNAGLAGNPEELDLSSLGALPSRPVPVLYATSSAGGLLYLRGSSFVDFDGTNWTRGESPDWGEAVVFPCLRHDEGYSLQIETLDPEPLLYTSYQLTQLPMGRKPVSDVYLDNPSGQKIYSMRYLPSALPKSVNAEYDAWVRAHCTALPEQTRQGMLDWWDAHSGMLSEFDPIAGSVGTMQIVIDGKTYNSMNPGAFGDITFVGGQEAIARAAAQLVSRCAKYSRNPLPMPEGVDFCTWFLNDAEEGYCVHYASACTALLRALDIPARYVSGYLCGAEPNETARVTNLQAHAWVEIWSEGRWIPIEPTPDEATEFPGNEANLGGDPAATGEDPQGGGFTEAETLPPVTEPRPLHTRPSRELSDSTEQPDTQPNGGSPSGGSGGGSEATDLTLLWVFLAVVGVPALVLGRRELRLRLWERRLRRARGNQLARLLYRRILRLHRLGGGPIPPEAEALAQKAAFSQHELGSDELHYLRQVHDQQGCRIGISGFWRRLYCKYVLAII